MSGLSRAPRPSLTMSGAVSRALDVAAACALLVATSPVLALAAGAVRVIDGGPVLFRQERAGRHGHPFTIYKLRTMTAATPSDEPEVTRLGSLLRACSVDELPQLVNVLRGDMALVGPRPLYPYYVPLYSPQQARRLEVRPGITGLAQISGRNSVGWPERLALDVAYVERRSLALDLRILAATVPSVLSRSGVVDPSVEGWFTGTAVETAVTTAVAGGTTS